MDHINWAMFGLVLLTGDMSFVFLWFFIWMPIGMNIKMEFQFRTFVRKARMAQGLDEVNIEGTVVKVTPNPTAPDPMTLGMSMGNP